MLKSSDLMKLPDPILRKYPRVKNVISLPSELIWIKAYAGAPLVVAKQMEATRLISWSSALRAISTGVAVDLDAGFNALFDVAYHVDCPSCGGNHVWFKHDALIAERPEPLHVGSDTAGRSQAQ